MARKRMLKKCFALISAFLEGPIPGEVGGGARPSLARKEGRKKHWDIHRIDSERVNAVDFTCCCG